MKRTGKCLYFGQRLSMLYMRSSTINKYISRLYALKNGLDCPLKNMICLAILEVNTAEAI